MKPSIIVYNVPGGKTRFSERIAKFYGFDNFHQGSDFHIKGIDEVGFIESTKWLAEWEEFGFTLKSFEEVAMEINAAIPLTEWRKGTPTIDGEYIASTTGSNLIRSYWRKGRWSNFFYESSPQKFKDDNASIKCPYKYLQCGVEWRGLSEEPINTEE